MKGGSCIGTQQFQDRSQIKLVFFKTFRKSIGLVEFLESPRLLTVATVIFFKYPVQTPTVITKSQLNMYCCNVQHMGEWDDGVCYRGYLPMFAPMIIGMAVLIGTSSPTRPGGIGRIWLDQNQNFHEHMNHHSDHIKQNKIKLIHQNQYLLFIKKMEKNSPSGWIYYRVSQNTVPTCSWHYIS